MSDDALESRVVLTPGVAAQPAVAGPSAAAAGAPGSGLSGPLSAVSATLRGALFSPLADTWTPPPLDWHPRRRCLAVVDCKGLVAIHDVDATAQRLVGTAERLAHAGIKGISAVAWRPKAKNFLAVAHSGGICLWTCEAGPSSATPAAGTRGFAAPSKWRRTSLSYGRKQPVTALCWSPCGQFLAAGSPNDSAFAVWDIATRSCTRLRSGLGGARVLRWSPAGGYLLVAGHATRHFEIWETHTWTCQSWSTGAHMLSDAAWSADEKVVLISLRGSVRLAILHFVSGPPSLLAHLLPLELPGSARWSAGTCIWSLAFDSAAQKMAVACTSALTDAGAAPHWVSVYALQSAPVYMAQLLGRVLQPAESDHVPDTVSGTGAQAAAGSVGHAAVSFSRSRSTNQGAPCALAVSWPDGVVSLAAV